MGAQRPLLCTPAVARTHCTQRAGQRTQPEGDEPQQVEGGKHGGEGGQRVCAGCGLAGDCVCGRLCAGAVCSRSSQAHPSPARPPGPLTARHVPPATKALQAGHRGAVRPVGALLFRTPFTSGGCPTPSTSLRLRLAYPHHGPAAARGPAIGMQRVEVHEELRGVAGGNGGRPDFARCCAQSTKALLTLASRRHPLAALSHL